jgi:disulfide bond formation protein DsbB
MLAGALAFQHLGGLAPCALCIDQRKAWGAVIGLAALAALAEGKSRIAISLALLMLAGVAALVGAGVAGYHVGVEQSWWQGTAACGAGFQGFGGGSAADLREQLLARPVVRCDEVAWSMLGISMAGWNGLISLAAGLATLVFVARDARRLRRT